MDNGEIHSFYASLVGSTVRVAGGVDLEVAEVTMPQVRAGYQTFAVRFLGPVDAPLEQGTVQLSLGPSEHEWVFIVPIGRDANAFTYEAVFNIEAVSTS